MSEKCPWGIVRAWMETYLSREHPSLPRPGAVCPFVRPALEADAIELRLEMIDGKEPVAEVLAVARPALADFAADVPEARTDPLRALVLAFPSLMGQGQVIDAAHVLLKTEAVGAGLMIGQFHEDCEEPSARNMGFPVNRSPMPLLVLRGMTVHDILFLHGDPVWFSLYAERFGHLFRGRRRIDPAFRELFELAESRRRAAAPLGVTV